MTDVNKMCLNKKSHNTKLDAIIATYQNSRKYNKKIRYYNCPICGKKHITSKSRKKMKLLYILTIIFLLGCSSNTEHLYLDTSPINDFFIVNFEQTSGDCGIPTINNIEVRNNIPLLEHDFCNTKYTLYKDNLNYEYSFSSECDFDPKVKHYYYLNQSGNVIWENRNYGHGLFKVIFISPDLECESSYYMILNK